MSPLLLAAVAGAGGVGAVLRWLLDLGVTRLAPRATGLGILIVNLTGSFALGLLAGVVPQGDLALVLDTGLCGGYTTFSAVAVLSAELDSRHGLIRSAAYTTATFVGCVAMAAAGLAVSAFAA